MNYEKNRAILNRPKVSFYDHIQVLEQHNTKFLDLMNDSQLFKEECGVHLLETKIYWMRKRYELSDILSTQCII